MIPFPLLAALVAGALAAGAASGAWVNGMRWENRWNEREIEILTAHTKALEEARANAKAIEDAADRIVRAPVRRVLCQPASAGAGVPADPAAAGVGAGGSVPADRDYGPALREAIALEARVRAYGVSTQRP